MERRPASVEVPEMAFRGMGGRGRVPGVRSREGGSESRFRIREPRLERVARDCSTLRGLVSYAWRDVLSVIRIHPMASVWSRGTRNDVRERHK